MEECLGGDDRVEVEGGEAPHEAIVRGGEVADATARPRANSFSIQ